MLGQMHHAMRPVDQNIGRRNHFERLSMERSLVQRRPGAYGPSQLMAQMIVMRPNPSQQSRQKPWLTRLFRRLVNARFAVKATKQARWVLRRLSRADKQEPTRNQGIMEGVADLLL